MRKIIDTDRTTHEDEPDPRASTLPGLETHEFELRFLGAQIRINNRVSTRSPGGVACATLLLAVAACLPGLGVLAASSSAHIAGWFPVTLAAGLFLVVMAFGCCLILQVQARPPNQSQHQEAEETDSSSATPG
jgi:hypothetical protein